MPKLVLVDNGENGRDPYLKRDNRAIKSMKRRAGFSTRKHRRERRKFESVYIEPKPLESKAVFIYN